MNCQDISRVVDSGSIRKLGAAEYDAAEAHARSCRDCAAIWGVQSRLAWVRVPSTPQAVATRFQLLASLPERPARGQSLRRLTVIGSLVALAAAAGVWMWLGADSRAQRSAWPVVTAAPTAVAPQPALESVELPAATITAPASLPATIAPLPLVPRPGTQPPSPPDPDKLTLALRKAVETHPELVTGPQLEDSASFLVALALRADGTVLSSIAEQASPATSFEISERLGRTLPAGGGETVFIGAAKGQPLPMGAIPRARIDLRAVFIRDDFDFAHSEVRVREILGHRFDDLMMPTNGEDARALTVFLSEDGRVLREKVDLLRWQDFIAGRVVASSKEEDIAAKLGIGVGQIGAVGTTQLMQEHRTVVTDHSGLSRLEDAGRSIFVRYVWERKDGDPAPDRALEHALAEPADFDIAAAVIVVQQLFPHAFSHSDPAAMDVLMPMPTVVFTARGEVIRSGYVQMVVNEPDTLQKQLVPGISTGLDRIVRLTDKTGATTMVHFAWEWSPQTMVAPDLPASRNGP